MFAIPQNQKLMFNFLCSSWFASLWGRKRNTTRLPRKAVSTGDNPDHEQREDFHRNIKLKQTNKQKLWNIGLNLHFSMAKTTLASFLDTLFQFELNFDLSLVFTVTLIVSVLQRIVSDRGRHCGLCRCCRCMRSRAKRKFQLWCFWETSRKSVRTQVSVSCEGVLFKFAKFKKKKTQINVIAKPGARQGGTDFLPFIWTQTILFFHFASKAPKSTNYTKLSTSMQTEQRLVQSQAAPHCNHRLKETIPVLGLFYLHRSSVSVTSCGQVPSCPTLTPPSSSWTTCRAEESLT